MPYDEKERTIDALQDALRFKRERDAYKHALKEIRAQLIATERREAALRERLRLNGIAEPRLEDT